MGIYLEIISDYQLMLSNLMKMNKIKRRKNFLKTYFQGKNKILLNKLILQIQPTLKILKIQSKIRWKKLPQNSN